MIFDQTKIEKLLKEFSSKNVLVIGDVMVDAYFLGRTNRISPEAPVPIIEVDNTFYNPGGAGNVALNLSTLGANVSIISIVGDDANGEILLDQLSSNEINVSKVIQLKNYKTPIKTRVIAQDQQVLRIDQEKNGVNIDRNIDEINDILGNIIDFDAIVIADYNKGLLSKKVIKLILESASRNNVPIYVDPKIANFFEYKGVRLIKPNILEFQIAMKTELSSDSIIEYGITFKKESNSDLLLITRGAKDALLFYNDSSVNIPTVTQSVHDVSGAGDTVIASFCLADICGASPEVAANIANIAASIVCSKVGVVPIQINDLKSRLSQS